LLTPFHTLHDYMALPRLTGLRLSPDGSWDHDLGPDQLRLLVTEARPDGAGIAAERRLGTPTAAACRRSARSGDRGVPGGRPPGLALPNRGT
jgi:hypothetical protein